MTEVFPNIPPGIENLHLGLLRRLTDDLPEYLEEASQTPISYAWRDEVNHRLLIASEEIRLEPLQEIWSVARARLNFPALIIHWQDTEYSEGTDEDDADGQDVTYQMILDLTLAHNDPERLTMIMDRYLLALRACLSSGLVAGYRISPRSEALVEAGELSSNTSILIRRAALTVVAAEY